MALFVWYNEIGGGTLKGGDIMRRFIGIATCETDNDADLVEQKASSISGVIINRTGANVELVFEPDGKYSVIEERITVAKIMSVIEPIQVHGFSMSS